MFYYTKNAETSKNTKHADNKPYTATIEKDGTKFTGNIAWAESHQAESQNFQAYYPYNAEVTSTAKAYGELPAEQTYDPAGWNISDYDFMVSGTHVATYGEAPTIPFKHLFSILRINITNGTSQELVVEKVKISADDESLILAGEFQANIGKGKLYEALRNANSESGTLGYFTAPSSEVSTSVVDGAVAVDEALDVRLMINAGYKDGSTTDFYLNGQKLHLEIYTTGNPVWKTEFEGGPLDRGTRAVKKVTIDGFEAGGDDTPTFTVSSITPDYDTTSERFYLNTIATLSGENLPAVTKLTVGGEEVPATGLQSSSNTIVFKIPDTVTFTSATDCEVVGYDSESNAYELGEIEVYPFFYYKDVKLGLGSDSSKTYTEYAAHNSIFIPDLGRVISAAEWHSTPIDRYVIEAEATATANGVTTNTEVANGALSSKNVINKTAIRDADYYAVMPYLFFLSNSDGYVSSAAPSNSASVLRNHYVINDKGSFSNMISYKIMGTPIIYYRVAPADWATKVTEGTLTTMNYTGSVPNATTPYLVGTSKVDGVWTEGNVLVMGYSSYAKGAKPSNVSDCAKIGFIHITEVTCADLTTGLALSPREGYIKFDFYWSKPLNDTASQPLYGDDSKPLSSDPVTPPTEEP